MFLASNFYEATYSCQTAGQKIHLVSEDIEALHGEAVDGRDNAGVRVGVLLAARVEIRHFSSSPRRPAIKKIKHSPCTGTACWDPAIWISCSTTSKSQINDKTLMRQMHFYKTYTGSRGLNNDTRCAGSPSIGQSRSSYWPFTGIQVSQHLVHTVQVALYHSRFLPDQANLQLFRFAKNVRKNRLFCVKLINKSSSSDQTSFTFCNLNSCSSFCLLRCWRNSLQKWTTSM